MNHKVRSQSMATAGGLTALVLWSATVALSRIARESLGIVTTAALVTGGGAVMSMTVSILLGRRPSAMLALPKKYLLGCGGLFVAYTVCFCAAVGLAPNRSMTLVVGLVNYLWPALTVVLSVPLLGRRARWWIVPGCVTAVAGTAAAVLGGGGFSWSDVTASGSSAGTSLLLAVCGAVAWALYSNLVKRWGRADLGAVPMFLAASAAVLCVLRLALPAETTRWDPPGIAALCLLATCQGTAAYVLWERGMRGGNHLLLSLASYFTPIASTAIAAVCLWVRPGAGLIVGCVLVTVGALLCRYSLSDSPDSAASGAEGLD